MDAIINKFQKTVFEAITKYSEKYGVADGQAQILISLDGSEDVKYTILKNYKKEEEVGFVKGIMFKKLDLTGTSIIVGQFIKNTLASFAEQYECSKSEVTCMIVKQGQSVKMWLYVGKDCKEEINLKKLLE